MHSGNAEYQVTARINRAFSGSAGRKSRIRPLTDELAQERGAELWGEIVIYGTFIGMAVWEYKKSQHSAQAQKAKDAQVMADIHASIAGVEKSLYEL